ncbi:hypothetical protein SDC9_65432 [bioreactor metagenome]|uniref:Uncharacterized protein n=1 Tax=bioreactor metagenome TaxID=1076179 RepID=A0A644XYA2_9ZZZZ
MLDGQQPLHRHVHPAHLPGQRFLAALDRLVAALPAEVLPDLGPGPRTGDELQPVPRRPRPLGLGGEDLHPIAGLQLRLQRHQPPVDPGPDAAVAHLGVHLVGEVDRRRALRQGQHVALRGVHDDLVHADREQQIVEELLGVLGLALPLVQRPDPVELVRVGAVPLALLVLPVRRDAVVGPPVHVPGADLELHRGALGATYGRVQRLVHVVLRHRDVVLEPPRQGVPPRVQDAQRPVAVLDGVDDDPQRDEVVDVLERAAADDHLLVDRVVVLRPAGDRGADPRPVQVAVDQLGDLLEEPLPRRRPLGDQVDDLVVQLGLHGGEGEVLQLPLDGVHPEPVGQRRVHLEGLRRDPVLLVGPQEVQRPHVVQPVGELDHQHPDVLAHVDDHLAQRLGLGRGAVGDLVELRHPVDEQRHRRAEVGGDLFQGVVGVLDGVVQQPSADGLLRGAQFGEDRRDGQRMGDVRVAALALLAGVVLGRGEVGALDHSQVGPRVTGTDRLEQRIQDVRLLGLGAEARQTLPHRQTRRVVHGHGQQFVTHGGLLPESPCRSLESSPVGNRHARRGPTAHGPGHGPCRPGDPARPRTGSRVVDGDQGGDLGLPQPGPGEHRTRVQEGQLHQHRDVHQLGPEPVDQARGRGEGAAGGQHVVDHQHPGTGPDRVGVDGQRLGAVLQVVADLVRLGGQLAGLADRHETGPQGDRHRGADDEATGLHADHHVDVGRGGRDELVDGGPEAGRVAEQRGDVLEADALLREVRDVADQRGDQSAPVHGGGRPGQGGRGHVRSLQCVRRRWSRVRCCGWWRSVAVRGADTSASASSGPSVTSTATTTGISGVPEPEVSSRSRSRSSCRASLRRQSFISAVRSFMSTSSEAAMKIDE